MIALKNTVTYCFGNRLCRHIIPVSINFNVSILQQSLQFLVGSFSFLNRALWCAYVIRTNKRTLLQQLFNFIMLSSTCFEQPSVHPQEDLCMQLYGIWFHASVCQGVFRVKYILTSTRLLTGRHEPCTHVAVTLTMSVPMCTVQHHL